MLKITPTISIILNIISVMIIIGYGIWIFLNALGHAYRNTNSSDAFNSLDRHTVVLVLFVIVTLFVFIMFRMEKFDKSIIWISIPFIVLAIGMIIVTLYNRHISQENYAKYLKETQERKNKIEVQDE